MDAGELVPDDIMIGIVDERLDQRRHAHRGASSSTASPAPWPRPRRWPRSPQRRPIDLVVDLEVPRERRARAAGVPAGLRTTAAPTTRSSGRRAYAWICDVCGGDVVQRDDDTEEAIHRRLDLYESQTAPLIGYWTAGDLLLEVVDGVGHARRGARPAGRRVDRTAPARRVSAP